MARKLGWLFQLYAMCQSMARKLGLLPVGSARWAEISVTHSIQMYCPMATKSGLMLARSADFNDLSQM
jgi:hypothetical protein